jgi:hypothetical protein
MAIGNLPLMYERNTGRQLILTEATASILNTQNQSIITLYTKYHTMYAILTAWAIVVNAIIF